MPRVPFDPATDYYSLLGVAPSASPEEIQAAYRRLAKAYHPDLNAGSTIAAARMARLNVAKSVLLDPAARASYDSLRRARAQRLGPRGGSRGPVSGQAGVSRRPVQPTAWTRTAQPGGQPPGSRTHAAEPQAGPWPQTDGPRADPWPQTGGFPPGRRAPAHRGPAGGREPAG